MHLHTNIAVSTQTLLFLFYFHSIYSGETEFVRASFGPIFANRIITVAAACPHDKKYCEKAMKSLTNSFQFFSLRKYKLVDNYNLTNLFIS